MNTLKKNHRRQIFWLTLLVLGLYLSIQVERPAIAEYHISHTEQPQLFSSLNQYGEQDQAIVKESQSHIMLAAVLTEPIGSLVLLFSYGSFLPGIIFGIIVFYLIYYKRYKALYGRDGKS